MSPAPLLDGIRRRDWTGRPAMAKRLGVVLAARGEVAYCVETPGAARISVRGHVTRPMRFTGAFGLRSRCRRAMELLLPGAVRRPWRLAI